MEEERVIPNLTFDFVLMFTDQSSPFFRIKLANGKARVDVDLQRSITQEGIFDWGKGLVNSFKINSFDRLDLVQLQWDWERLIKELQTSNLYTVTVIDSTKKDIEKLTDQLTNFQIAAWHARRQKSVSKKVAK